MNENEQPRGPRRIVLRFENSGMVIEGARGGHIKPGTGWLLAHDVLHHWPSEPYDICAELQSFGAEAWMDLASTAQADFVEQVFEFVFEAFGNCEDEQVLRGKLERLEMAVARSEAHVRGGFDPRADADLVERCTRQARGVYGAMRAMLDQEEDRLDNLHASVVHAGIIEPQDDVMAWLESLGLDVHILAGAARASRRFARPADMLGCFESVASLCGRIWHWHCKRLVRLSRSQLARLSPTCTIEVDEQRGAASWVVDDAPATTPTRCPGRAKRPRVQATPA